VIGESKKVGIGLLAKRLIVEKERAKIREKKAPKRLIK